MMVFSVCHFSHHLPAITVYMEFKNSNFASSKVRVKVSSSMEPKETEQSGLVIWASRQAVRFSPLVI
jgi:hypothetical protein